MRYVEDDGVQLCEIDKQRPEYNAAMCFLTSDDAASLMSRLIGWYAVLA